jgi:hypothetical protein
MKKLRRYTLQEENSESMSTSKKRDSSTSNGGAKSVEKFAKRQKSARAPPDPIQIVHEGNGAGTGFLFTVRTDSKFLDVCTFNGSCRLGAKGLLTDGKTRFVECPNLHQRAYTSSGAAIAVMTDEGVRLGLKDLDYATDQTVSCWLWKGHPSKSACGTPDFAMMGTGSLLCLSDCFEPYRTSNSSIFFLNQVC